MFERANRATANFEKKKQDSRDPFCVLEAENMVQKGRSDVLDMVRLPDPPEEEEVLEDITCSICFDDVEGDKCIKLKSCGHQYCLDVNNNSNNKLFIVSEQKFNVSYHFLLGTIRSVAYLFELFLESSYPKQKNSLIHIIFWVCASNPC